LKPLLGFEPRPELSRLFVPYAGSAIAKDQMLAADRELRGCIVQCAPLTAPRIAIEPRQDVFCSERVGLAGLALVPQSRAYPELVRAVP
jgi:hypothetical protein